MKRKFTLFIATATLLILVAGPVLAQGFPQNGTGNPLPWNKVMKIGGEGGITPTDMTYDISGNCYVTGYFNGTVTFAGNSFTSVGMWDLFLAKFNTSGNLIWFRQASGDADTRVKGFAVKINSKGDIWVLGANDVVVHFGSFTLSGSGSFLAKFSKYGEPVKIVRTGNSGISVTKQMAIGSGDEIYFTTQDGYFAKYDSTGANLWMTIQPVTFTDIDERNGSVAVSGWFYGDQIPFADTVMNGQGYNKNGFYALFDGYGSLIWTRSVTAPYYSPAYSLLFDQNNNLWVTGYGDEMLTFYPSVQLIVSAAYYVVKISPAGDCLGASYVFNENNYADDMYPPQIMTNDYGDLYLTGYHWLPVTAGSTTLTSTGYFLAQLDPSGNGVWAVAINNSPAASVCLNGGGIIMTGKLASGNLYLTSYSSGGSWQWTKTNTSDAMYADSWYTLGVDAAGNVVMHGNYVGDANLLGTPVTGSGTYFASIRGNQTVRWVKAISPSANGGAVSASGAAADKEQNVIVWGIFSKIISVEGHMLSVVDPNIGVYLIKYSVDGSFVFATSFYCTGNITLVGGITTDQDNNILLTGYYSGTLNFGAITLTASSSQDIFFAKFSSAGMLLWAKTLGGSSGTNYGRSIACDAVNNVYITGGFSKSVDFGNIVLTTTARDVYIAKYTPDGAPVWAKKAGLDDKTERGHAIIIDPFSNVYITGSYSGPYMDFNGTQVSSPYTGASQLFVAKYSGNGDFLWGRALGTPVYSWPLYQIGTDAEGNLYAGGSYSDTLWLENGTVLYGGYGSMCVVSYAPDGSLNWYKNLDGKNSSTFISSVSAFSKNSILASGRIYDDVILFDSQIKSSANGSGFLGLLGNDLPSIIVSHELPENGILAYPNPAVEKVTIEFPAAPLQEIDVSLLDMQGRSCFRDSYTPQQRIEITLPQLPAGSYILKVQTGGNGCFTKIIIQ